MAVFKGIPYAAPPFGARRFQPPAPAVAWDGVRPALAYGPTAPMPGYPAPFDSILPNPSIPGEDCLNLNVWTPDIGGSGLPVMVWIHGGAFANGSGAVATYDGSAFARDGVVCVTINYRLGIDGFLWLEDRPANRGLLDQVAALEWVQENIAAFGGDPGRVTIFGESAGGMSVATLLSMPLARGLFGRATAQSGAGHHTVSLDTARKVAARLSAALDGPVEAEALAGVPLDRLMGAQRALSLEAALNRDPDDWGEVVLNGMAFEPVVDGEVLPGRPHELLAAGRGAGVDVLTGTTAEEHRLFIVPNGLIDLVDEGWLRATAAGYGMSADELDLYRRTQPGGSLGDVLAALITDWYFRIPAVRLAEARARHGESVHVYEFAWRSPLFEGRLGACHALEIPFVFEQLEADGEEPMLGATPPAGLGARMHRAWVDFATQGDPGWPAYDLAQRPVMRFDETCQVVNDPAREERLLWEGRR